MRHFNHAPAPPVADFAARATAKIERGPADYAALVAATWGVGYIPLAPATWGSAVGVGLYLIARAVGAHVLTGAAAHGWGAAQLELFRVTLLLAVLAPLAICGLWAATRAERLLGRKDPRPVVVDEVVGQLITFLFVPFAAGLWTIVVGFFVFRAFDILKPYPIQRLEALEAGLGIMADDVLAGVYAAILMSLLLSVSLLL